MRARVERENGCAREGGRARGRVGLGAGLAAPGGAARLLRLLWRARARACEPGTLLTAERVVAPDGEVLWEGEPLDVPGALRAVICAADGVADEPGARRALAETSGAVAVDMESGRACGERPARRA